MPANLVAHLRKSPETTSSNTSAVPTTSASDPPAGEMDLVPVTIHASRHQLPRLELTDSDAPTLHLPDPLFQIVMAYLECRDLGTLECFLGQWPTRFSTIRHAREALVLGSAQMAVLAPKLRLALDRKLSEQHLELAKKQHHALEIQYETTRKELHSYAEKSWFTRPGKASYAAKQQEQANIWAQYMAAQTNINAAIVAKRALHSPAPRVNLSWVEERERDRAESKCRVAQQDLTCAVVPGASHAHPKLMAWTEERIGLVYCHTWDDDDFDTAPLGLSPAGRDELVSCIGLAGLDSHAWREILGGSGDVPQRIHSAKLRELQRQVIESAYPHVLNAFAILEQAAGRPIPTLPINPPF